MSPRSMLLVEDELRTSLLGRERPDPELGRLLYCSKFLMEEMLLKDNAARERAKVFGNDVKEAVRSLFIFLRPHLFFFCDGAFVIILATPFLKKVENLRSDGRLFVFCVNSGGLRQ